MIVVNMTLNVEDKKNLRKIVGQGGDIPVHLSTPSLKLRYFY